jgi:hypothetical protein
MVTSQLSQKTLQVTISMEKAWRGGVYLSSQQQQEA